MDGRNFSKTAIVPTTTVNHHVAKESLTRSFPMQSEVELQSAANKTRLMHRVAIRRKFSITHDTFLSFSLCACAAILRFPATIILAPSLPVPSLSFLFRFFLSELSGTIWNAVTATTIFRREPPT